MEESFEDITLFGIPMLFANHRLDRTKYPETLYFYDIRHDDMQEGTPVEVANYVLVNHWGTVISYKPIPDMVENVWAVSRFIREDDWNYEGTTSTLNEYLERNKEHERL